MATKGTGDFLCEHGVSVDYVSDLIQSPEILGGRVKTLHPSIHGGILARSSELEELSALGIEAIDLVIVNLYPFPDAILQDSQTHTDLVEQIDIGGVALIRAAAKNHERVAVVVDPADYPWLASRMLCGTNLTEEDRLRLAAKAFRLTSYYDALIADWMAPALSHSNESWPEKFPLALARSQILRYGENPHQRAALYRLGGEKHRTTLVSGHSKPLSYNNLLDIDSASSCVSAFERPACVIVKHAGPCGVAVSDSPLAAYERAYQADAVSAFGGVIAFNRLLDIEVVETILAQQFVEVLLAPGFTPAAVSRLEQKPKLRALRINPDAAERAPWQVRTLSDGVLIQEWDRYRSDESACRSVAKRPPTSQEQADLLFAWIVARFVPSNALVLAHEGQTRGIGGGQPNRIDSLFLAREKARRAGLDQGPCVLASDGFLPFPDVVEQAAALGVTALIQPGGALRDEMVVAMADQHAMAVVMTGLRHFRH